MGMEQSKYHGRNFFGVHVSMEGIKITRIRHILGQMPNIDSNN